MKSMRINISDDLHYALRVRAATGGIGMGECLMRALCAYVGMEFIPVVLEVIEKPIVDEPIVNIEHKEPTKRLGAVPKDGVVGNRDAKYHTGFCPIHGQMAIGGKWPCCPDA